LFGEKYGEEVRVVSMGGDDEAHHYFSTELCGGTHVRRTGDIGLFIIVGEGAVAAGVRRIDALTGKAAVDYVVERDRMLTEAADTLKVQPAELPSRIGALMEERRKLERELSDARRALALGGGSSAGASTNGAGTKDVAGIKLATRLLEGVPARELKSLADDLKKQIGSGVIAIVATHDGKAANLVAVTDDLAKRFDARELVKAGVAALGGQGGGGRADMAQGGGPAVDQAAAALAAIEAALRSRAAG